jgi:hypothetical protein
MLLSAMLEHAGIASAMKTCINHGMTIEVFSAGRFSKQA